MAAPNLPPYITPNSTNWGTAPGRRASFTPNISVETLLCRHTSGMPGGPCPGPGPPPRVYGLKHLPDLTDRAGGISGSPSSALPRAPRRAEAWSGPRAPCVGVRGQALCAGCRGHGGGPRRAGRSGVQLRAEVGNGWAQGQALRGQRRRELSSEETPQLRLRLGAERDSAGARGQRGWCQDWGDTWPCDGTPWKWPRGPGARPHTCPSFRAASGPGL